MEANGFHVVLVEDDNICLKVVEQLLRKLSYRVSTASDGAAALKVLADCKQRGDKVDLILTDILMPEVRCGQAWSQARRATSGRGTWRRVQCAVLGGQGLD